MRWRLDTACPKQQAAVQYEWEGVAVGLLQRRLSCRRSASRAGACKEKQKVVVCRVYRL